MEIGTIKVNPIDGAAMIFIPAGEFLMGDDDRPDNPRRIVTFTVSSTRTGAPAASRAVVCPGEPALSPVEGAGRRPPCRLFFGLEPAQK